MRLVLHMRLGCGSLSSIIPVSLLANEFGTKGIVGASELGSCTSNCVVHEANGCENLKIH